jgi:hypothetical protein
MSGKMQKVACRVFPWVRLAVLAVFLVGAGSVLWLWNPDVLERWLALTGVSFAALVGWVAKGLVAWRSGSPGIPSDSIKQPPTWPQRSDAPGLRRPLIAN